MLERQPSKAFMIVQKYFKIFQKSGIFCGWVYSFLLYSKKLQKRYSFRPKKDTIVGLRVLLSLFVIGSPLCFHWVHFTFCIAGPISCILGAVWHLIVVGIHDSCCVLISCSGKLLWYGPLNQKQWFYTILIWRCLIGHLDLGNSFSVPIASQYFCLCM